MKINELNESPDRNYVNLPKEDIERLRQKFLPDWEYKDNSLQKKYKFEDYFEVIEFLINTIKPQEKLDHHADIGLFYVYRSLLTLHRRTLLSLRDDPIFPEA